MKPKYYLSYTTPDGSTYIAKACRYYSGHIDKKNLRHIFYIDEEGSRFRVICKEWHVNLMDEYRRRSRFITKKQVLMGMPVGVSIRRPYVSSRDYHSWCSLMTTYSTNSGGEYVWKMHRNKTTDEIIITRLK